MPDMTIQVDLDKPCRKCGSHGVAPTGLCFRCATKALQDETRGSARMDTKNDQQIDLIISTAVEMIISQLEDHRDGLADALARNGELSVSIGVKAVREGTVNLLGSKVAFTKEKVVDEKKRMIHDQEQLPFDAAKSVGDLVQEHNVQEISRDRKAR